LMAGNYPFGWGQKAVKAGKLFTDRSAC
jgi:hypothetical protein